MALTSILDRIKGLVFSADELQSISKWPRALVEDYLNLFDNLYNLALTIDTKSSYDVQTITSNYIILTTDGTILINAISNNVTALLPVSHTSGEEHAIKVINATHDCYVDPNGSLIDRSTSLLKLYLDESIRVRSDGINWWIL